MPLRVSYVLADLAGEVWYLLSPRLRGVLRYNLGLLPGLGEDRPRADGTGAGGVHGRRGLARRISRNFGRVVAEFLYSPRINPENLSVYFDLESFEPLRKYAEPPGAVFATAHLGNWEFAGAVLAMLGIDLTVIVYDDPDSRVARLFRERREARGMKVVPVKAASRELKAAVRGSSLGVVADRDFSGQGMVTTFLGVRARMPFAYAGFAVSHGMPVVFGICVKRDDGKYHLIVEEPMYGDREDPESGRKIAEQCIGKIEKYVEKYPEQWYVFEKIGGELS
jgi:KDO2-lipid IV(A) lauroyltransferase